MPRILIVDDDPDILETIRFVLEDAGYEVDTAANGREALDHLLARREPPAGILLDMLMPVMDGEQFLAAMKEVPSLAAIPVIVLSAASTIAPPPGTRVIRKPVSLEGLLGAMREQFRPTNPC